MKTFIDDLERKTKIASEPKSLALPSTPEWRPQLIPKAVFDHLDDPTFKIGESTQMEVDFDI